MGATNLNDLTGKVALVTGGGNGIGAAISRYLADAGASVAVTDLDRNAANDVAADLQEAHGYRLDVTSARDAGSVVKQIESDLGPIDILCNNAGVATMNWLWDLTEEEWDLNFDVNTKGVFIVTQAVVPGMMERRSGVIVNTASMAGKKAAALLAHYSASKWAVIGFSNAAAIELGPYGIRVNSVCPGFVETPMQARELVWESELRGMTQEACKAEYIEKTPLGRIETADDVARSVLYLASPASEFLTGAALDVTGGAHLT